MPSAYLRLLTFLLAVLIPACASSCQVLCMMWSVYKLNKQVTTYRLDILLSRFWPIHRYMFGSNCFFLSCKEASHETGKVVWYSHLLKNFPVWCDQHSQRLWHSQQSRSRSFSGTLVFSVIQWMLAIWSQVLLPFLNLALTSGSSQFMYCWSLAWRILSITLLACEMSALCYNLSILWHCLSLGLEWKLTFSSPMVLLCGNR